MNTFKTSQLARSIGVHPNTIRLYETIGFIPKAKRAPNGYRIFTNFHLYQLKIVHAALEVEIVHHGLRKKTIDIIKTSANGQVEKAIKLTKEYQKQIQQETNNAEEAICIVHSILDGKQELGPMLLKRKEVSKYLNISMDTLRNWELNGLIQVKRKANGYRIYTEEDMQRLKVIHALRCANYSLVAILRMLGALSKDPDINIKKVIDTPHRNENIVTACDELLTSLSSAKKNAQEILSTLIYMKKHL